MNDVIVVGGGVVGAAVTRALSIAGARVTLLEAKRIGAGTSRATFSWVNANQKLPREYFELNVAGMRAHQAYADSHEDPQWLHHGGNAEWAIDAPARKQLRDKAERLRGWGYGVEELSVAELRALEPDLRVEDEAEVVFFPEEMWVDPVQLAASLLSEAQAHGAHIVTASPVAALPVVNGRVTGVVTADHLLRSADVVVNCAGPAAGRIAELAGAVLPMANTPGVLAYTEPAPVGIRRVLHSPNVQIRPDGGGRLVLHAESQDDVVSAGEDVGPTHPVSQQLLSMAQEALPGLSGTRVEAVRAAVRPIPGDGVSVVGWQPQVENLYTVVSHSAATLCLALADLCSDEMINGTHDAVPEIFRPARFSAQ